MRLPVPAGVPVVHRLSVPLELSSVARPAGQTVTNLSMLVIKYFRCEDIGESQWRLEE